MEKINFTPKEEPVIKEKEKFIKGKSFDELGEQIGLVYNFLRAYDSLSDDSSGGSPNEFNEIKKSETESLKNLDQLSLQYLREPLADLNIDLNAARNAAQRQKAINSYSKDRASLLEIYGEVLREALKVQKEKINKLFLESIGNKPIDPEIKSDLDKKTINLGGELSPEQKEILRKNFPSGNFLLHTASAKNSLMIIESGKILSSLEIAKEKNVEWGHDGGAGISFNMNDVRVLTGDSKHLIGFLVAPETALTDNYDLVVPWRSAKYEVRLVPRSYDKDLNISKPTPKDWGVYPEKEMPMVDINKTFVFCNEFDADILKKIMAANKKEPAGIITYPNKEIRVRSWKKPVGDYEVAGKFIKQAFREAGIHPSIDWAKDLFLKPPKIEYDTYVSDGSVKRAFKIIKKEGSLYVEHPKKPRFLFG